MQSPPTVLSAAARADPSLSTQRLWALVPCAGSGRRAGAAGPKQYQTIAGKPMLLHTLAALGQVDLFEKLMVVVAPDDDFLDTLAIQNELPFVQFTIVKCGGATRAQSVLNGLHALVAAGGAPNDWVLVHDAARCLVTPEQVTALIKACLHDEVGGLLALALPDTLKNARAGRVSGTIDRGNKWLAQTPQMFRIGPLMSALAAADGAVTDESSAMEAMGLSPKLVPGSAQNFKVTYPEDFSLAEAVIFSRRHVDASPVSKIETTYDYP